MRRDVSYRNADKKSSAVAGAERGKWVSLRRDLSLIENASASTSGRIRAVVGRKREVAMRRAPALLLIASAKHAFERDLSYLIDEFIVDRVVPREHSINERPIERVDKDFRIEIGLKLALIDPAL
jgi:hypothetical protein